MMPYEQNGSNLNFWANASAAVIWAFIGIGGISVCFNLYAVYEWGNFSVAAGNSVDLFNILIALVFLISAIVISVWIYKAHDNLRVMGVEGLEFSPGWSVGWFAVPFANLVMPYRAMRELWQRSGAEVGVASRNLLPYWWGGFIIGGFFETFADQMMEGENITYVGFIMLAIGVALRIASAWFLLDIIRKVNRAQSDGLHLSDVFA